MKNILAIFTVIMLLAGCNYNNQSTKHIEGDTWEDSLYQYRVIRQRKPKNDTSYHFNNSGSIRKATSEDFNDHNEVVVCIENMAFVKTSNGNLIQIKNHNGTYKKCVTGTKENPIKYTKGMMTEIGKWYMAGDTIIQSTSNNHTPISGYGSKHTPIPYRKGLPINMNWWYNVGGIDMKATHGDPLGILKIDELFSKVDLDRRESF